MYSIGLDIGSSSIKAAIVDIATGHALSSVKCPSNEMKIISPHPLWAEQHADDWWAYVIESIKLSISQSGIEASKIKAIGISYQMHGLVCVDKNGMSLRPSIIWCDSRAIEMGDLLEQNLDQEVIEKKLYNNPGNFTAAKLLWVKTHEPQIYEKIYKIMLPGDYIAYKMSGAFTTTFTGLSEGIFYDFEEHELAQDVLNAGGFDKDIFPIAGGSFESLCESNMDFENITGIKAGTPISYRAGDQPNNAFSLGVINDGETAATGGTSGVIYNVSSEVMYDPRSRVNSFAHINHEKHNPKIGSLLCINGTGIALSWLRNNFFNQSSYEDLDQMASSVNVGSDGLIHFSFGNGAERMLGNIVKGASFQNMDYNRHSSKHMVRATLEGIAFAFNYGIEVMKELNMNFVNLKVGNDNLFQSKIFSQTLANITGNVILIYETTGAIGAAKGAALGAGYYHNINEAISNIQKVKSIEPIVKNEVYVNAYKLWKKELDEIKF